MLDFFTFKKIQIILKKISENIRFLFEQEQGRNEFCKICGKSVPSSNFEIQFQDEDRLESRCLYCNKTFIKAREKILK
ncbi:hypothetical protein [uncultured Cetobacterium sp.]|uniref:hypothetical protein n=1 Tax=uncultured Cetobacterium sp. TaxID=527638 RepID=UPI002608FE68|nr:hypothetical protein [uncultured Cetobacterium sp.]